MRHRLPLIVAVVAAALALPVVASAQQTISGTFKDQLLRPAGPCSPTAIFCITGTFDNAPATVTFTLTSFSPTSRSCADVTGITEITLADAQQSVLTLADTGQVCFPGNSMVGQGIQARSYGNPFQQAGSLSLISGTGRYASATSASGSDSFFSAGAAFSATVTVTLS